MVVHTATRYGRFSVSQWGRNASLEFTAIVKPGRNASQWAQTPLALGMGVGVSSSHIAHVPSRSTAAASVRTAPRLPSAPLCFPQHSKVSYLK